MRHMSPVACGADEEDTMKTFDHTRPIDLNTRPLPSPGEFFSTRRALEQLIRRADREEAKRKARTRTYNITPEDIVWGQ
jgi:hypothetical protein